MNHEPITKKEKDNNAPLSPARQKTMVRPDDVSEQVWQDFLTHRKTKRATVTDTVLNTYRRESEKAGLTLEAAISESVAQGWQGFKAEWYLKTKGAAGKEKDGCRAAGKPGKYDNIGVTV
jgi:hypothetical protein